jgi:hypothetical protein
MTMVSKYPQNTPSPGTPIGISQFRVTVRAITNKFQTSMLKLKFEGEDEL